MNKQNIDTAKQDPYLDKLQKQQQRRAQSVRTVAVLLLVEGLGALIYALILAFSSQKTQTQSAVMFFAALLGVASLVAGAVILLRAIKGEGGTGFDDVINNFAPRILGGQDPDKLAEHVRRGKRRPRLRK